MKLYINFILVLLLCTAVQAQIGGSVSATDARSTGMGGTFTASSRGLFAVGKNPANLSISENGRLEIQTNLIPLPLPSMSMGIGTDFMTIENFNYFFGGVPDPANPSENIGRPLTNADKQRFVDMFADGGNFYSNVSLPIFGIYVKASDKAGAFAFSVNDNISFNMSVPKGLPQFAMNGFGNDSLVSFTDLKARFWYLRDYSLSYSREMYDVLEGMGVPKDLFQSFSFGITVKYVQGFAYAESERFNASITSSMDRLLFNANASGVSAFSPDFAVKYEFDKATYGKEAKFGPAPASAGDGIGIDFGFTARLNNQMQFAFAMTNIGNISWSTNAARFTYNNSIELTSLTEESQRDAASDDLKEYKGEYITDLSTPLPTALRLGAAYEFDKETAVGAAIPGKLLLTVDYNQALNDMPGNYNSSRVSFGMEWKPMNWIPFIRTGISMGGVEKFNWALGLGFNAGVFDLAIATRDFDNLISNQAKRGSVAIDTRWKF